MIQKSFRKDLFDTLLLACTELPTALQECITNQQLAVGSDEQEVVDVVDSELIFAEIIRKNLWKEIY